MIKVERYSETGFNPRYQSYHLRTINLYLLSDNDFLKELNRNNSNNYKLNDYQKEMMLNLKHIKENFLKEHYEDFKYGVWVFIKGHMTKFELNHIKDKSLPPVSYAYLPDDIDVYDCNLEKCLKLNDHQCKYYGVYVPKRSLQNIILL